MKELKLISCILSDHGTIKLELNNLKNRNYGNTWRLNNAFIKLMDHRKIKEEIRQFLNSKDNGSKIYLNLWDTIKALLREKLIAANACIRKNKEIQINSLIIYMKVLEK